MSLQDQVKTGISNRNDFPLQPGKAALLIIDIQKYLATSNEKSYLATEAVPRTLNNIKKLTNAFRKIRDKNLNNTDNNNTNNYTTNGCEVVFIYLQCLTNDGRDISLDYKLSGPFLANIPRYGLTPEDLFLKECFPDIPSDTKQSKGDILIPKTSCSIFRSTNIDYVLRNLGIEQIVVTGQLTDICVDSAVRDAADAGYFVTVVHDACAAHSEENHERGLQRMKGFSRLVDTDQVLKELRSLERKINSLEKISDCKRICLGQKHELLTLPRKTKFRGFEIIESECQYPQTKCTGCPKRIRTYCRCSPGIVRCQECYAKHLIETDNGENDLV